MTAEIEVDVRMIPVQDLIKSPNNGRVISEDDPRTIGLAESIRSVDILQPILVRPVPADVELELHQQHNIKWAEDVRIFEIVAGHRRVVACNMAGKKTVPALVRSYSDEEAIEAMVVENLEREDLEVMEEAEQIKMLRDSGFDIVEIASKIGRTKQWVYGRAAIAELSPEFKDAIKLARDDWEMKVKKNDPWLSGKESGFDKWGVSHLLEVAKAPVDIQKKLIRDYKGYYGTPTHYDVKQKVNSYTRVLGEAPFDVTDETLIKSRGDCVKCIERQGNRPDLFDIQEEVPIEKDRCLNEICFKKKVLANGRKALKAVKAEATEVLEVKGKDSVGGGYAIGVSYEFENADGYFKEVKEGDPGAKVAVDTGSHGKGKKRYVKKVKSKGTNGGSGSTREVVTCGRLQDNHERRRVLKMVDIIEERLADLSWEEMVEAGWDHWRLIRMVLVPVFVNPPHNGYDWLEGKVGRRIARNKKMEEQALLAELWDAGKNAVLRGTRDRKDVRAFCLEVGWNKKEIEKEADDALPVPELIKDLPRDQEAPDGWEDLRLIYV